MFNKWWPVNHHVIGKDIIRFHNVYWPAMLMSAGIEPPKGWAVGGWLLVGGEKMSKSKLTGIAPSQITDTFGSDAFRYYFMKAIAFGSDGSFSWEDLSARYQAELANGFGNLASRVIAMVHRYFDGALPAAVDYTDADLQIQKIAADAVVSADQAIEKVAIHEAISAIWVLVDELNNYITVQEPWVLAKDEVTRARLATVLNTTVEGLRVLAVLLNPITPKATEKLWAAIGGSLGDLGDQQTLDAGNWSQFSAGAQIGELEALFPRIETTEEAK
jgi:methionyl-tRNA synthetase